MLKVGKEIDPEFIALIETVPKELLRLNGISEIDPIKLSKDYMVSESVVDHSIDPNANVNGKSPVNYFLEIFKPLLKYQSYYLLWKEIKKVFGKENADICIKNSLNGTLYIHDLTKLLCPYCFAPDSSFWMTQGRPYGWLPGGAPKRLQSFIGQTVEVAMDMSQDNAGAIGIANVLINAAYFTKQEREQYSTAVVEICGKYFLDSDAKAMICRMFATNEDEFNKFMKIPLSLKDSRVLTFMDFADKLYDKEIENTLQQFVHVLHNGFRLGGDSPFTNISLFCTETIKRTFGDAVYPDWTSPADNIKEIMRVQQIFAEFFSKGSPLTGKNYRFPVCTVNVYAEKMPDGRSKVIDVEFLEKMSRLNAKRGVFNFHSGEKLASCCRLTSSLKDLRDKIRTDSFGNGGISIGSHRVVTLNLHNIACNSLIKNLEFIYLVKEAQRQAMMILIAHKNILKKAIDAGTLKFFKIKWADLNMFFSTFGFTGLWDAYKVLETSETDYVEFAKDVLLTLESEADNYSKCYDGFAFNVEEIPAENASPKLARMDNYNFSKYDNYKEVVLLSNQMIPLYEDVDCFERLETMGKLMNIVSGGSICHFNVDGSMTEEASIRIVKMLMEDFNIPHFAIEIGTSTCKNSHTNVGIHAICPTCKGEIDHWTRRVVGFNSDTKDWIKERREWENLKRRVYEIPV